MAGTSREAGSPRIPGQGRLFVVGTPIGNLGDLSARTASVLGSVDAVLCEDTRVTAKLMSHLGLHVPLERCDENVIGRRAAAIVGRIEGGERVAFVSDAGMPAVSDPGQVLVDAALDAGLPVEVVPGPSAVTCALVASGLPVEHFFFEGFLPRKASAKAERLAELACVPGALVFYESPHRVEATLSAVAEAYPLRRAALVRELTKVHEECRRGPSGELAAAISADVAAGNPVRGECVIVVEGPVEGEKGAAAEPAVDADALAAELAASLPASKAAKELARRLGIDRQEAFEKILAAKG